MKLRNLILLVGLAGLGSVYGATNVSYSATASPSSDPDSGLVNVWTTTTTTGDGGQAGFFLGDSSGNGGAAGAGTVAWATYANSNQETSAQHVFDGGALNVGQTVSLQFDNGGIATDKSTGIQLFSGNTLLFQLYFRGGQSFYEYFDGVTFDQDTTAGFSNDGGTFSFTLESASTYSASWRGANWTGTLNGSGIDKIGVYNNSAGSGSGSNVYFNNLTVVPEPTSAALGLLGTALLLRRRRF